MTATSAKPLKPINSSISMDSLAHWLSDKVDSVFNRLFALTHNAAMGRSFIISILFFLVAVFLTAGTRSFEQWLELFGNSFLASLNPAAVLPNGDAGSSAFANLLGAILWNPEVLRRLIALYAPFWLMHRVTAIYLADIFEKDEPVARDFIMQAAFGTNYNTVRIREGKIVEADQDSPMVQIGGPGYVIVELDSAVLFERPDGTPHVVAPTVGAWHGKQVVEGFERIRQAADLREIMGSQEVNARSRDGIPIIAKDIQYSYSIYRGENPVKNLQTPYPFIEKALEDLAYKIPRPIKLGVAPPAKPDWLSPLPGRIAGSIQLELGGFISRRGLSEFLASIGAPEEAALRSREDELDKMGQHLSGRTDNNSGEILFRPAEFTSRSAITALFYNEEGFKKRAADRGFQVNWIGVGTWVTPTEIIPANHLEAWKLSRENFVRSDPEQISRLEEDARLQESLRLIQTMPVGKFYTELKQANDAELIDSLIGDYYERIQSALELYEREGEEPPLTVLEALRILNEVRGINQRWISEG